MNLWKRIKRIFIDDGELPIDVRKRVVSAEPQVAKPIWMDESGNLTKEQIEKFRIWLKNQPSDERLHVSSMNTTKQQSHKSEHDTKS
jgi:hypothetical protein